MASGLSFGSLPAFADLTPEQQAMVMQSLQQARPAPAPVAQSPMGGLLRQVDPQAGPPAGPQAVGGPPGAVDEAQTQRLERQQASPQDLAALGGSPIDRLLFDRAGMGDGPNGFTGSADPMGSRMVPIPPSRPSDDALAYPQATSGIPGSPQAQTVASSKAVPGPLPNQHVPATPADRAVEPTGGRPLAGDFDPLTGQPLSGSPRPLGAPQGAVSPSGAAAATAASGQGQQPGFMDRFINGLNSPDGSNFLRSLSIGLLTQRGIGPGIGAGLSHYDASQAGSLKGQLEQIKFLQEQQQQNAARAYLKAKGVSPELVALGAASPSSVLSGALTGLNQQPPANYRMAADGKSYEYIPGSEADPDVKGKLAAAGRDGSYTLSPGQTRYDEEGKPVTSVPAAPRELRPGATLYDPVTLKPIVSAPSAKPDGFDTETKLRGEFRKDVGSFQDVHDGYGRVIAATKQRQENPNSVSPAADINLIFGYMKMLDPGSVVREGEYATAKNAAGVPERVLNTYNKLVNGEFLTDRQREDFLGQASELYGTARKTAEGVADRYRGLATQYGVDPGRAVYLPETPTPPRIGQPSPQAAPNIPQGAPAGTRRAPDGNLYAPDPARPGKYLQVR